MTPQHFIAELASFDLPAVFNPWGNHCRHFDRDNAAAVRRKNLEKVLEAVLDTRVETIWIARDLGYRGGRRTGLPLTDEVHLAAAGELFGGVSLERSTKGPPIAERTAAVVWRVLEAIGEPVVLWNVFPFHPHLPNDPQSNRCHTRVERHATWPVLKQLIEMVRPKQLVAIGRDAHAATADLGLQSMLVRHPSYGGQAEFVAGLKSIYGFPEELERRATQVAFASPHAAAGIPA